MAEMHTGCPERCFREVRVSRNNQGKGLGGVQYKPYDLFELVSALRHEIQKRGGKQKRIRRPSHLL